MDTGFCNYSTRFIASEDACSALMPQRPACACALVVRFLVRELSASV